MMSLMPTAMPRSGPALAARAFWSRQTNAPMAFSCTAIASCDCAMAASGESSPDSMRRWSSASEIMGTFLEGDKAGFTEQIGPGQADAMLDRTFQLREAAACTTEQPAPRSLPIRIGSTGYG